MSGAGAFEGEQDTTPGLRELTMAGGWLGQEVWDGRAHAAGGRFLRLTFEIHLRAA